MLARAVMPLASPPARLGAVTLQHPASGPRSRPAQPRQRSADPAGSGPPSPSAPSRLLARHALALTVAAVVSLALAGCMAFSPQQTTRDYNPTDGVPVDMGPIQVRSLVVVAESKDSPGALAGAAVNTGSVVTDVAFGVPGQAPSGTVTVPARTSTQLSSVTIASVPVNPGSVMAISVSTPDRGEVNVVVPVVRRSGFFETITPSPVATP